MENNKSKLVPEGVALVPEGVATAYKITKATGCTNWSVDPIVKNWIEKYLPKGWSEKDLV